MSISVVILTHNEEKMLAGCLESVQWADETIVIDKRSSDQTKSIAKKYGATVVDFDGEHFDEWRNLGIYRTTHDWILYIDPDERVTQDLKQEINSIFEKASDQTKAGIGVAYRMPRKNIWWGKEFTSCGASPDYVTRLFKKDCLKEWKGIIHESPVVLGEIKTLNHPLIHFTHRDLISGLKKSYQWTRMEAESMLKAHHPPVTWWRLMKVTLEAFVQKYIAQKGFMAGTEGLIEAAVQAWNRFMVYEQLWEMQRKPSLEKTYEQWESKTV